MPYYDVEKLLAQLKRRQAMQKEETEKLLAQLKSRQAVAKEENERLLRKLRGESMAILSKPTPLPPPPTHIQVTLAAYQMGYAFGSHMKARREVAPTPQVARTETPWLRWVLVAGTTLGTYKLVQALCDEEFPGRTLPQALRYELKFAHLETHGSYCLCCRLSTEFDDLVIDHIVAHKNGGRTSIANSRVICKWCNVEKGAKNTLLDFIRGRGGRID